MHEHTMNQSIYLSILSNNISVCVRLSLPFSLSPSIHQRLRFSSHSWTQMQFEVFGHSDDFLCQYWSDPLYSLMRDNPPPPPTPQSVQKNIFVCSDLVKRLFSKCSDLLLWMFFSAAAEEWWWDFSATSILHDLKMLSSFFFYVNENC